MRRVGDFMEDLGFKADAPEGAQKAFIKNLLRAAYGADVKNLADYMTDHRDPLPPSQPPQKIFDQPLKKVSGEPVEQMAFPFMKESR